jgi:hypothetical protein
MHQATATPAAVIWTIVVEPSGREIQQPAADRKHARLAAWNAMSDAERNGCESLEIVDVLVLPEATPDNLTANLTAFDTFANMLNAQGGYRPSLHTSERNTDKNAPALRRLADLYDEAQAARGDARRAYRY